MSVNVPGVMTCKTFLSTRPFFCGSDICSQMATLFPELINFPIYDADE